MPTPDEFATTERQQTDESSRAEREKADQVLEHERGPPTTACARVRS
jgi:hypothetical protein